MVSQHPNGFFCRKTSRLLGVKMKIADVGRKTNHESENLDHDFSSFLLVTHYSFSKNHGFLSGKNGVLLCLKGNC